MSSSNGIKAWYLRHFKSEYPMVYAGAIFLIIIPFLYPLGIPLPIGEHARTMYDYIESTPPGSTYLMYNALRPSNYPECGYALETNILHALRRGIRVIIVTSRLEELPSITITWANLRKDLEKYEYGVDWVNLGALTHGTEEQVAAFARDLTWMGIDYYGTPLSQIPLMQEIKTAKDITAVFDYVMGPPAAMVRQWISVYNTPHLLISSGCQAADSMGLIPKYAMCSLNSNMGSAEYMILVGDHRLPVKMVDAITLTMLYGAMVMIIGNLRHRRRVIKG
jgi:hypothetical protein